MLYQVVEKGFDWFSLEDFFFAFELFNEVRQKLENLIANVREKFDLLPTGINLQYTAKGNHNYR